MNVSYNRIEQEEEEQGSNEISFFFVKTRLGNYTRRCCFVEHDSPLLRNFPNPPNNIQDLKDLYLKTVNIPYYWFADLEPALGFEAIEEPKWMPGIFLFKIINNSWKGT